MKRILALDTSTKSQALALVENTAPVARRLSVVRRNHSATLLRNIDDMLEQAGWSRESLDGVGVGLGPGTFTGLRVGLATAKAIARATGAALVGVGSIDAIANPVTHLFEGKVVAVADARRGEVYVAEYRRGPAGLERLSSPRAATPEEVVASLGTGEPTVLVGPGVEAYPAFEAACEMEGVKVLPPAWNGPSSVSIAFLARQKFESHGPDDIAALEPDYVRLSDAELNFGPPDATESVLK